MNYGDLHWVDLPDRGGREQRGRRPALIWQDTDLFPRVPTVLIIPFTAQLDTLRFGATVRIDPTEANGLAAPSVALIFQLGASDVRRIGNMLGHLSEGDLARIRDVAGKLQRFA